MANKEHGKNKEKKGKPNSVIVPVEKKDKPSKGFVEELVRSIKIQTLWKQAIDVGDEVSLSKINNIEEGLKSSKIDIKKKAEVDWNDLWKQYSQAEKEASRSLAEVVEKLEDKQPGLGEKARLLDEKITQFDGREEAGKTLIKELDELATEIGIKSNLEGMREIEEKIEMMNIKMEIQPHLDNPKHTRHYISEKHKDEFDINNEKRTLFKVRQELDSRTDLKETEDQWGKFLDKVRNEVLPEDKSELDILSGQELVNRLQEVGFWQMNRDTLAGRELSGVQLKEQRMLLEKIEATYLGALEKRTQADLGDKAPDNIAEGMAVALKKRRGYRRSFYKFGDKEKNGDTEVQYKKFIVDVVHESVKRRGSDRGVGQVGGQKMPTPGSQAEMLMESNQLELEQLKQESELLKQRMSRATELLKKIDIDIDDKDLNDLEKRSVKLKQANEKLQGLTGLEKEDRLSLVQILHDLEKIGAIDAMSEMNELMAKGKYSAFMVKLEAYIDRVGLKETSSDWQFAIMLRRAKDTISHFNSDLGGKFDMWQEGQFIPGITDVDEDTFIKMIPRVLSAGRLNYELNTKYSNWTAMQAEIGDKKINLSTASILQMLESEEFGRRVMDAQVNGNEGVMYQLLVEHMFGKDARLDVIEGAKPGETLFRIMRGDQILVDVNQKIKINYFEIVEGSSKIDYSEGLNIKELLEQSSSMANYAKRMWWWMGDWERFVADFDNDHLSQANKRLMSIGASLRDYGLEYGKFHPVFEELVKLGVMLPPYSTYKKSDMVVKNIMHAFVDDGIGNARRGEQVGKAVTKMIFRTIKIKETGNEYMGGKRSIEEIRLMANLPKNNKEAWDWWLGLQKGMKRTNLRSYDEIQGILNIAEGKRTDEQMAWSIQFEEVLAQVDELRIARQEIDRLGLSASELRPLMKNQAMHMSGEYVEGEETLNKFLENFEFSSVISYDEREKGTDALDYSNYFAMKKEVASLLPKIMRGGMPTMDQIKELFDKFTGYVNPPADKLKWFQDFMVRWIKFRTWQWREYEIAMTDREDWLAQKERGLNPEGSEPVGYATATYKLKDDRGDTWNVKGRDGMRVSKKRKTKYCEAWTKYKIPMLRVGDIEPLMTFMTANGMLPTTEMGEEIMGRAFGVTEPLHILEKVYHNKTGKHLPKWMHSAGHIADKVSFLIRKHPLFDDPVWAFWSISNELWEYVSEVGKDITKEVVGGHH